MARIQLQFPEDQFYYSTHLTVRVTDINGANHLANDSMISMISEARARFARGTPVRSAIARLRALLVVAAASLACYKAASEKADLVW